MNTTVWWAVAGGGAAGSVLRYGLGLATRALWPGWPWGTWMVNVAGSFLMGVLFAAFILHPVPEWIRVGLITGALGGFTTFSAFSIETLELARTSGVSAAGMYVVATLAMGLAACAFGVWAARWLLA